MFDRVEYLTRKGSMMFDRCSHGWLRPTFPDGVINKLDVAFLDRIVDCLPIGKCFFPNHIILLALIGECVVRVSTI
jgi:hypothetical protein